MGTIRNSSPEFVARVEIIRRVFVVVVYLCIERRIYEQRTISNDDGNRAQCPVDTAFLRNTDHSISISNQLQPNKRPD